MSNEIFFDQSSLDSLKGKVVVLTGGASGIGREAVTIFAKAGARIVFGDIDKVNGDKLASRLGRWAYLASCWYVTVLIQVMLKAT